MKTHGVKRLVYMSAFGVGSSYAQLPFAMKAVFRHTNMKFQIEDHEAVDAEVRGKAGEGRPGERWGLMGAQALRSEIWGTRNLWRYFHDGLCARREEEGGDREGEGEPDVALPEEVDEADAQGLILELRPDWAADWNPHVLQ